MRKIFYFGYVSLLIAGCYSVPEEFTERIKGADSIAVSYFRGNGTMDTVAAVKIIRDRKSIETFTGLITTGAAAVKEKCGNDGAVHFFKNDRVVQDVFFSSKDECRQFLFRLNGKDAATELNDKAKEFLTALKNK